MIADAEHTSVSNAHNAAGTAQHCMHDDDRRAGDVVTVAAHVAASLWTD